MKLTDRIIPVPQKVTEGENILGKVTAYTLQCNIPEDAYLGRIANNVSANKQQHEGHLFTHGWSKKVVLWHVAMDEGREP